MSEETRYSKGGNARAEKLTAERRSEIAKQAAATRWSSDVPLAAYEGYVLFGDVEIPCAVLPDGTRLLSERGVTKGLGLKRAGSNWQRENKTGARMPVFLSAENLNPFIDNDLRLALISPVLYKAKSSPGAVSYGVPAKVIPMVCDVWLKARDAGVLKKQQVHVATQADIVMRGLALVGIIALVDEATGYQADRAADALEKILAKFISKELCKWAWTFKPEFYREMFRLRGIDASEFTTKRPQYVGHLTNDIVYKRLAPGVLDELRKVTPRNDSGRLKTQLHRRLTREQGHPQLREHLASIVTIMKLSKTWDEFYEKLNDVHPLWTPQKRLEFTD
jgi:hypothetical protein